MNYMKSKYYQQIKNLLFKITKYQLNGILIISYCIYGREFDDFITFRKIEDIETKKNGRY